MTKTATKPTGSDRLTAIDALTLDQMRSALAYISGFSPEAFDSAVEHVSRSAGLSDSTFLFLRSVGR
jgi:hypothetical protein